MSLDLEDRAADSAGARTAPAKADGIADGATIRKAATTPAADAPTLTWFDGELVAADSPCVALTTHALHYGSGVFEGIRCYAMPAGGVAVFRLPEHLERMRRGAELLGIPFDVAQATLAVIATLRANRCGDAYVRPLAWCGTGTIGLDVEPTSKHLMVAAIPMTTRVHLGGGGVKLGVSKWRRNPASSLPPLKLCGAYVNSILAKADVRSRGFDEALFVDGDGMVVECSGANVFMVRGGRIVAVEHPDALPGITRDTLLALTGADTRPVSLRELREADEVFVCGTAAEASSIASLDGRSFGDAVGREVARQYQRVVHGLEARERGWLTHA